MKSLKAKVVALVTICAVVSTCICGGLSLLRTQSVSNQNMAKQMAMQCENSGQEIDTTLIRVEQSVDTLARIMEQSLTDIDKFKTDSRYVEKYTESLRSVALEFANNTEGALTYYIRYNPEFTEPTSGIFASRNSAAEAFEQLVPTDFSMYDPSDAAHVGWYYIPVQNGTATWMDPYLNANIDVYMISYVVPIFVDGVSVGIVGMDIDFGSIEDLTGSVKIYDTGSAFLVNSGNQVVYHDEVAFGTAIADVEGSSLSALDAALSDASKEGSEIRYSYNGVQKIGCYKSLANGMKFVLTAPKSEVRAESARLLFTILFSGVLAVLFSALVGFFLSSGIAKPLKQMTEIVRKNAQLNLKPDSRLEKLEKLKDETGAMARAVKEMNERLRGIVKRLEGTGELVLSSAEQINESSGRVGEMCSDNSATTEELAAAMEEAAATAETINRDVATVDDKASMIARLSQNGEADAGRISERAQALSHTTREATERTKAMYEQMRQETEGAIAKSRAVEKINELTQNILEISAQTNLLALNASIEAARAGDAGRGFAVVAEEIGSLASQTQNTVKNIDAIIEEVYVAVKGMAACLHSSTEFLEKTVLEDYGEFMHVGEQYASDAENYEKSMKDIMQAVHTLEEAILDIREASDVIGRMTGESAVGISHIAEKTTDIVQRMADEEELAKMNRSNAGSLKAIVDSFILE